MKTFEVVVDGNKLGNVTVPDGSAEREVVRAALRVPAVAEKLKVDGVAASVVSEKRFEVLPRNSKLTLPRINLGQPLFIETVDGIDVPVFALRK